MMIDTHFLLNRSQCVIFNGKRSRNPPVTSGVHRGSLLRPVLFLVFINDLEELDCQVALFAGDMLMYQTMKCSHNTWNLQENSTPLSKWADK